MQCPIDNHGDFSGCGHGDNRLTIPSYLRDLLNHDDAVIFVGSGISQWSGLPSWTGLIEDLASFMERSGLDANLVRQEAKNGEMLQAASYARAKLSPAQFGAFIRLACQTGSVLPHAIHHALMALGPSCFITTNYDDLLEQAFRQRKMPPTEPHVVPNRNILEQANLVQTSARAFIFKPHGDARDAESIVLTREHYRQMLPGGAFASALNTLEWLLASRPVLFVGFGLRDPDFLFVRDLLANAYRGGIRDHYALIADPLPDQIDWWRDFMGVHLVGYETRARADGVRDHGALLEMLEDLRITASSPHVASLREGSLNIDEPAIVLELARYGASVMAPEAIEQFDIAITRIEKAKSRRFREGRSFDHWPVNRLLAEGPRRLILTGAPGAGKSFAIRHTVNAMGSSLQDACLQGTLSGGTGVPVAVDLKLYDGNLMRLISERFPTHMSLAKLCATLPVRLFLDSYNEAPREHRDSGALDADIDKLIEAFPTLGLVVGSRSVDGLERLGLPMFELSTMPVSETEQLITAAGSAIPEQYLDEIRRILQRPFYFRLVAKADVALQNVRSPADLYGAYIDFVVRRFHSTFDTVTPLREILCQQGYQALELGTETFELDGLASIIAHYTPPLSRQEIEEILNWLAAAEILVPLGGGRAAFVHQSVTEYLAACRLTEKLGRGETTATEMITYRRWDNAIFLALSLSDAVTAKAVMQEIASADLLFAIRGANYVENRRDDVLELLLETLLSKRAMIVGWGHDRAFEQLNFAARHETLLMQVIAEIEPLRGAAIGAVAKIRGEQFKPELIRLLFDEPLNWQTRAAMGALANLIEPQDVAPLLDRALALDPTSLDSDSGDTSERISALAIALGKTPVNVFEDEIFVRIASAPVDQQRILAKLFGEYDYQTERKLRIARLAELLRAGLTNNAFALHIRTYRDAAYAAELVPEANDAFLDRLVTLIGQGDKWAAALLQTMCELSAAIAARVAARTDAASATMAAVLGYCVGAKPDSLFAWLEAIVRSPNPVTVSPELRAVDLPALDWTGRESLLISLLGRKELSLTSLLLGGGVPVRIKGLDRLPFGDPRPWLDWLVQLTDIEEPQEQNDHSTSPFFTQAQLAYLLARSASDDRTVQLLEVLVEDDPLRVWAVGTLVLPYVNDLTFDDFSEPAVEVLLDLLQTQNFGVMREHIFAFIAPESFISERLLPLAEQSDNAQLRRNIAHIADTAGKRLAIRFGIPDLSTSENP